MKYSATVHASLYCDYVTIMCINPFYITLHAPNPISAVVVNQVISLIPQMNLRNKISDELSIIHSFLFIIS